MIPQITVTKQMPVAQHPLYQTWASMKNRCYREKTDAFKYYGAKGIGVCQRWRESFWNFVSDMGEKPSPKHQIDRIDSNGDYTPENCRWSLPKQQQNNRSSNHMIEFRGETKTLQEWCDLLGLDKHLVTKRINVYGLTVEDALTRPVRAHMGDRKDAAIKNSKPITFNGETHTMNEWARRIGMSRCALSSRIKRWGVERALSEPRKHP